MTRSKLLEQLNNIPNGRLFKITWEREIPTYKGIDSKVTKIVETVARKGIKYTNTKYYKNKQAKKQNDTNGANKEVKAVTELLWGHWIEKNLLIGHTNKQGIYKEYLRLYPAINKPKIKWLCDGKEVNKEELKGIATANGLKSKDIEGCYTISIDNIVKVGN